MWPAQEVNRVSEVVTGLADPSANIIFGAVIDEAYEGEVHVTIIATGFTQSFEENLLSGKAVVRAPGSQAAMSQRSPCTRVRPTRRKPAGWQGHSVPPQQLSSHELSASAAHRRRQTINRGLQEDLLPSKPWCSGGSWRPWC